LNVRERLSRCAPLERPSNDAGSSGHRYRVAVDARALATEGLAGRPSIVVTDRQAGDVLFAWHGSVVRHLLESRIVDCPESRGTSFACDKSFVQHLALAAASVQIAIEESPLARKLEQDRGQGSALSGAHRHIACILFRYPEHHFSRGEVGLMLALEQCPMSPPVAERCLDDLVTWRLLQQIDVGPDLTFYDVNTEPHLHVYDPDRNELRDASACGVIHSSSRTLTASLSVNEEDRVLLADGGV